MAETNGVSDGNSVIPLRAKLSLPKKLGNITVFELLLYDIILKSLNLSANKKLHFTDRAYIIFNRCLAKLDTLNRNTHMTNFGVPFRVN